MDLISRLAAIDTEGLDAQIRCEMCRNPMHTDRGCDGNCKYNEKLYGRIMQILGERMKPLPSAQVRTEMSSADTINRWAAIDAIDKYSVWVTYTQGDSQKDEAEFVENIIKQTKKAIQSMLREDLPSAQLETITCNQCVYYQQNHHYCEFLDTEFSPSDYCSMAERREE